MTEIDTFDDFTIAETQLWGRNIGKPFSDYPLVFRHVLTVATYEIAQETDAGWYKRYLEGASEDWVAPVIATEDGEKPLVFRQSMAMELPVEAVVSANLVDWCDDVLLVSEHDNAIRFRAEVVNELQLELSASGDWDDWLCHMAYVMRRRGDAAKGVASQSWRDYCKDVSSEDSKAVGAACFTLWVFSRVPLDIEEPEGEDSDSPLDGERSHSSDIPTAAV